MANIDSGAFPHPEIAQQVGEYFGEMHQTAEQGQGGEYRFVGSFSFPRWLLPQVAAGLSAQEAIELEPPYEYSASPRLLDREIGRYRNWTAIRVSYGFDLLRAVVSSPYEPAPDTIDSVGRYLIRNNIEEQPHELNVTQFSVVDSGDKYQEVEFGESPQLFGWLINDVRELQDGVR